MHFISLLKKYIQYFWKKVWTHFYFYAIDTEVVEKQAKEETVVENATPDYAAGLVSTQVKPSKTNLTKTNQSKTKKIVLTWLKHCNGILLTCWNMSLYVKIFTYFFQNSIIFSPKKLFSQGEGEQVMCRLFSSYFSSSILETRVQLFLSQDVGSTRMLCPALAFQWETVGPVWQAKVGQSQEWRSLPLFLQSAKRMF